jgi:hypothetical protein
MTLRPSVFALAAVAVTIIGAIGGVTPTVAAEPPLPPTEETFIDPANRCFFDLTPPSLVELPGGAKAVTATAVAKRCTGTAGATNVVVCVSTPEGPGECGNEINWEVAEVFVTASRYVGPFTATAVGCWRQTTAQFQEKCQPSGPLTTTL